MSNTISVKFCDLLQCESVTFRHLIVIWKIVFFSQWLIVCSVKNMHFMSVCIYFQLLAFLGHEAFVLLNTSFYSSCLLNMSFLVSDLAFFWSCFYLSYFISFSTPLTLELKYVHWDNNSLKSVFSYCMHNVVYLRI